MTCRTSELRTMLRAEGRLVKSQGSGAAGQCGAVSALTRSESTAPTAEPTGQLWGGQTAVVKPVVVKPVVAAEWSGGDPTVRGRALAAIRPLLI